MIPVRSSNVRAIGLDGARILVQFDNGVYECVRSDGSEANAAVAFERFLAAESKGKFYTEFIRRAPGVWNVQKLEDALAAQLAPKADEQALARAITEAKAVKEVEKQQAVNRFDTAPIPRSLLQTIKEMLEVVPESETALRERLTELWEMARDGERVDMSGTATQMLWESIGSALTIHVGSPYQFAEEEKTGKGSWQWKYDVWNIFYGPPAVARQSQSAPARHKFNVDMSKSGQSADSCLECPYSRKHPVHFSAFEQTEQSLAAHIFPDAVNHTGIRRLILTVGLPRSGKTSWARATGFPIVSPDAIRLALHGRAFEPLAEPFVWATARLMVRSLFLAGHETVVLDACNVTRARRDEWRGSEWETFCIVFECSREEAIRRVEADILSGSQDGAGDVPYARMSAIDRMAKNFEPLGEDEQVWMGAPMLFNVGELKGIVAYPTSEKE